MANTKITSRVIADDAILTANIADDQITSALMADDVALGGNPTTSTQTAGNNTTRIATTAFVSTAVANIVNSAPSTLDTLGEIATALGNDAALNTTLTNSIAAKLPLAGGTMTGNIAHASDFTLDVGGDIILDADGGDIKFADAGTTVLEIKHESSSIDFLLNTTNDDFKFKGSDDGSTITALTLDMSDAGTASFNHDIKLPDNGQIILGAKSGGDAQLFHSGSNAQFINTTGDTYIQNDNIVYITNEATSKNSAAFDTDGAVTLYNDNSAKLATSSTGITVTGGVVSSNDTDTQSIFGRTFIGAGISGLDDYAGVGHIDVADSGGYALLQSSGGATFLNSEDGHDLYFLNHGTTKMILKDGKVGIGTTSPSSKLHIKAAGGGTDKAFYVTDSNGNETFCIQGGGRVNVRYYPFIVGNDSGHSVLSNARMFIDGTTFDTTVDSVGRLLIGTTTALSDSAVTVDGGDMMVHGANNSAGITDLLPGYTRGDYGVFYSTANTIYFRIASSYVSYIASNGTYNVSDERLKENISTLTGALGKVKQLRGVSHTWKDTEERGTDTAIGLIAQEVEAVYPELVGNGGLPKDNEGNDPYKSVNYAHLTSVLIEAIKELSAELDSAKSRIATLEGN